MTAQKYRTGWNRGDIKDIVSDVVTEYCMKLSENPSATYGIHGSRIIKLELRQNGKITANYDRGWDIEPKDVNSIAALGTLIAEVSK